MRRRVWLWLAAGTTCLVLAVILVSRRRADHVRLAVEAEGNKNLAVDVAGDQPADQPSRQDQSKEPSREPGIAPTVVSITGIVRNDHGDAVVGAAIDLIWATRADLEMECAWREDDWGTLVRQRASTESKASG